MIQRLDNLRASRFLCLLVAFATLAQAQTPIRGFGGAALHKEQTLEKKFRDLPDPEHIRTFLRRLTQEPHAAGSPASKAVAEYALGLLKEWGYDASIEEFEALLPYPTVRSLEMTAPVRFQPTLAEPAIASDPDSSDAGQLPPYLAYAASGEATADLVYVNYGIPADYEQLAKLGIDVKGKIVIARYGQSWRGTKVKVAAEHGALACLIYSDPRDDGYFQGDVYPNGPFRPAESVQRGSVMDMPIYVGDPLSPGWASEPGSRRLDRSEAVTLMKIPALPISYRDAQPLLEQLRGPVAPIEWRGALPITYHIGPGPATVHLKVDYDWTNKPLYNVIARMPGSEWPDEWVIYGNHHDAWVSGAADPSSGAATLLETARSVGELARSGWRPKRTILFTLWDAEEFGLVGSTEWVEKHQDELQQKTVLYLNSDNTTDGRLGAGGSFLLEAFLREVLRDVPDPVTGSSLLSLYGEGDHRGIFQMSPLGSGSDYVAFEHHSGIPSINLGFSKSGSGGSYHSVYDSYTWFTKYMDTEFRYTRALAQVEGTSLLRFAEAPVLPYDFNGLATSLRGYMEELRKQKVNPKPVLDQLDDLDKRAARWDRLIQRAAGKNPADHPGAWIEMNRLLRTSEQELLRTEGLPGRPWYKHELHAPGLYAGYGVKTIPAIREALEAGNTAAAEAELRRLANTLERFNAHVDEILRAAGDL